MQRHRTSLPSLLGCDDIAISWTSYNNQSTQTFSCYTADWGASARAGDHRPGSCRGLSAAWWSGPTHSRWTRTTRPPPAAAACQSSAPASHTPAAVWSDPATQFHITVLLTELLGGYTGTSFRHRCIIRRLAT